jgi:hypothetical protein
MGKMFQNASSLKPLGHLKPNCPGIIIWRSSKRLGFLCRSEIQDGCHRRTYINIGPYGKMFKYEHSETWGKRQWDNNPKVKLYQKCLLLRNYKSDSIQTTQECSLDSALQSLGFLLWYEIQDGGYGRT